MSFIPNGINARTEMLKTIGLDDIDQLFSSIPSDLRSGSLDIPEGRSEFEVEKHIRTLGARNYSNLTYFIGGGFYDHFIPSAVDSLSSRGEFFTAYTPYQPEASQGTLQAIYEYQSCICRLTGMEVANASVYDGGTALYEAAMMAIRITKRNKIVMDGGVNPIYRKMINSYTHNLNIGFSEVPVCHGQSDRDEIEKHIDEDTAAVILQNPNFFGAVDDHSDIVNKAHEHGALVISSVYPISLGMLKTPAEMGVDIVTGEGQSLGIPLSFGGPYLGFMATREKFIRMMPGRICGETVDTKGRRAYVLTFQTREQHIRREKANSNICSNQSLCALRALIYMSLVGNAGLKNIATQCRDKAEFTKEKLSNIDGVHVMSSSPTFNEFTIQLPVNANQVIGRLIEKGIAAGFPLGRYYPEMENYLLVAVTEKRSKHEIIMFADAIEDALWN
ncbi:MAG: aminomethyl-transferring glycine dehydrogenase subunit GcvPA [Spirochaetales bacterium]|uniref:Probable glycine dehydrogenase (decarboxylating) subunit 1 n=1 Tax=Candidatus Thalassospirochaeta sargassi TaxID=3119039 RepID=A0AAJ1IH36_9SPIO|nr:aminomethyl-transferring glycine dehydrogenase subunit GcvPA [Spirochaetales bacterium]